MVTLGSDLKFIQCLGRPPGVDVHRDKWGYEDTILLLKPDEIKLQEISHRYHKFLGILYPKPVHNGRRSACIRVETEKRHCRKECKHFETLLQ